MEILPTSINFRITLITGESYGHTAEILVGNPRNLKDFIKIIFLIHSIGNGRVSLEF